MQLQQASRIKAKIKLGLQGPSGSGKTYSALLLAYGLVEDWTKIAVVDTENNSSHLYAHLGKFNVLSLGAPFSPERYIEAIRYCVKSGMEVIIIDSISHEWQSVGGILDIHSNMAGNSFTNWSKLTPRHNAFIQEILQSPVHVIATIRAKQEYVLVDKNGKQVPEKMGLIGVTREGLDYDLTLVFEIDIKHNATATKDRTAIFMDRPEFKISSATGKKILEWCNDGAEEPKQPDFLKRINDCKSLPELLKLYQSNPQLQRTYHDDFTKKRESFNPEKTDNNINSSIKSSNNGTANSHVTFKK